MQKVGRQGMTINHFEDITTEIWCQVTSTKKFQLYFDVWRNDKFNIPMNGAKLDPVQVESNKYRTVNYKC